MAAAICRYQPFTAKLLRTKGFIPGRILVAAELQKIKVAIRFALHYILSFSLKN